MGLSEWFGDALTDYNKVFSEGLSDFTTRDVEVLTGHQAHSSEPFAGDFAESPLPRPSKYRHSNPEGLQAVKRET